MGESIKYQHPDSSAATEAEVSLFLSATWKELKNIILETKPTKVLRTQSGLLECISILALFDWRTDLELAEEM